ncbi:hypothetical protein GCM10010961_40060 [Pseudodonghicola xiamenensis]|uniref:Uncharacterized protein n=1 Tax=Pseudodonghicola xiamenensis TaxID=337702 RepID=A0A8J3MGS8_9RHOB|nr:hypothetical protein GCM10010961_40060 [Pseudodonghicola xiamenensis]
MNIDQPGADKAVTAVDLFRDGAGPLATDLKDTIAGKGEILIFDQLVAKGCIVPGHDKSGIADDCGRSAGRIGHAGGVLGS